MQQRRKVSESAPAMAYMRARAYMGGLGTTSKSRPALAGVVDRAPPPMHVSDILPATKRLWLCYKKSQGRLLPAHS
jgi:hypothetical protein